MMDKMATSKFIELAGSAKHAELETAGSTMIQLQLREQGIARRIFNFTPVDTSKLYREVDSDQVYDLIDVAPGAGAVTTNFTAGIPTKYIYGQRAKLTFGQFEGQTVEKTVEELLAMNMDVFGLIKDYTEKEIMTVEDSVLFKAFEAALAATDPSKTGKKVVKIDDLAAGPGYIKKEYFTPLLNTLDADRLKASRLICAESDLNDVFLWTTNSVGFQIPNDLMTKKDARNTIRNEFGPLDVVSSIKTDMFREKVINGATTEEYKIMYVVTDNDFLGKARELTPITFWTEKKRNRIRMGAYENIGMVIANARAIGKIMIRIK